MRRLFFVYGIYMVGGLIDTAVWASGDVSVDLFHTPPDKWSAPPIYHPAGDPHLADRMRLSKVPYAGGLPERFVLSSNGAYGFFARSLVEGEASTGALQLHVFNERPYFVRIELSELYLNFAPEVRWINQKLLYVEVWWGRLEGSYFIFDVEREEVVITEAFRDGRVAFRQWKEAAGGGKQTGEEKPSGR
ncbi:hypothetical protein P0Y35_15325 [Kiritimatiellaeota bacterium B1221]|nr:hypothetical protein [Kiritimatiellaeota bacterium B1221]